MDRNVTTYYGSIDQMARELERQLKKLRRAAKEGAEGKNRSNHCITDIKKVGQLQVELEEYATKWAAELKLG